MSQYDELKRLASAAPGGPWIAENDSLYFKDDGYTRHLLDADAGHDVEDEAYYAALKFIATANPAAIKALIAENDEYKAVAEQPASLNASPAAEYEGLKRQFFALRNYALCKDKLSGYYSRELERLRGVDRSQSAGEIDAERDINEQLTNDLLAVEAERDQLKAENDRLESEAVYSAAGFDAAREEISKLRAEVAGLKTDYQAYEQANAELKAEVEGLRKDADKWKSVQRAGDQLLSDEGGAAIWSACSRVLISVASELNSGRSVVTQEGVTIGDRGIGDWRVSVERIDAAIGKGE